MRWDSVRRLERGCKPGTSALTWPLLAQLWVWCSLLAPAAGEPKRIRWAHADARWDKAAQLKL